jgi:hypothetical protein
LVECWSMPHLERVMANSSADFQRETERHSLYLSALPLTMSSTPGIAAICLEDVTIRQLHQVVYTVNNINLEGRLIRAMCEDVFF